MKASAAMAQPEPLRLRYRSQLPDPMVLDANASLFDVTVPTISEHLKNIYQQGEVTREATIRKFRTVQAEGSRKVSRDVEYYNLDAIISVG